jgi:dTDP-4-dehydrorhamnose reductase
MNGHEGVELWGGFECSVTRVRDSYYDQLERTGHAYRIEDLDILRAMGIRAVRYPVLWERVAPNSLADADWRWSDARLHRLRELGIRPIVGLVHHGSGPSHTNLLDPGFVDGLRDFAREVAARYPWVQDFTPVNEPVTTARFATLYGHWYPHHRSPESFARAMLIQSRAIIEAMSAIREVTPHARLIHTEDFSVVRSTPRLTYQAGFENLRRWLGVDLLCGRVDAKHPLFLHLLELGLAEDELSEIRERPCAPDVLGLNYYVTSERYLDESLERYPQWTHGGNDREAYADVEAVRACEDSITSHERVLRESWDRYHIPLAITEAHLGCSREEQLRWFMEAWRGAAAAKAGGVDVRAVTMWALAGSADWNSLMTERAGYFESGALEIREVLPRPTALVSLAREIVNGGTLDHPVLAIPGWWRRQERIAYPAHERAPDVVVHHGFDLRHARWSARPLLITGATGTLGRAFGRICERRGIPYVLLGRAEVDVADARSVRHALSRYQPWAVVNAAGYVRVHDAPREARRCMRENAVGVMVLARAAAERGIPLLTFSSDLVFDGLKGVAYVESDPVSPRCTYGRSKALAEVEARRFHPEALIVRTSAFFGPWDPYNFLTGLLQQLATEGQVQPAGAGIVSPTYVPDLVEACLDLLLDGVSGVRHLANAGSISWCELRSKALEQCGVARDPATFGENGTGSNSLLNTTLASEYGSLLPTLDDAMERYFSEPTVRALVDRVREGAAVTVSELLGDEDLGDRALVA